ncbi:MAG: dihydroorotate dehydrogenase-like protein [bacterium]|nr:dihydroorotate dehydrogenase-like protein [bacterium]
MSFDMETQYLGLQLRNPVTVAACPLSGEVAKLLELQAAGAAAVVLPSLFEEQIEHDELEVARMLDLWALSSPESPGYFPELDNYNTGPEEYLDLIREAKQSLEIPVIASLNGCSPGGWVKYAGLIERAEADALELNIYHLPTRCSESGAEVEQRYCELVGSIKQNVDLPVSVKIGPYFSSIPGMAGKLAATGADGLVCFNRFLAPDVDLQNLNYEPALEFSTSSELRHALRWIAILRDQLELSLAANGGVHTSADLIKALLAGADVVALASALLQHGPHRIAELIQGLNAWGEEHEYESVQQMRGSLSLNRCPNPDDLKRANYMRALVSHTPK